MLNKMCAELSLGNGNHRKLDRPRPKPFRRPVFWQYIVLVFFILFIGIYWVIEMYLYKRNMSELCLPIAASLGLFLLLRIMLFLQELILYRSNISHTVELLIQPSSSSSEYPNGYGFWIRLVVFSLAVSQLPSQKEMWFENKFDLLLTLFLIALGIHLQWHDCALLESHGLEKPLSYSGGSAMAFSFYYGYLRLIAPGLVTRINQYQNTEHIPDYQIPQKKLYVLIPSSSFIFDKLEGYQKCTKTNDLKIDHDADKFNCHKQDRGLVKGRTYKNTMYTVEYSEKEVYYILLEGATPVKTFYETCKEHNQFERNKNEVISSFYYTLKKLIRKNKEMKGLVKLIYYDDEKRDITIPEIVKERILKIRDRSKED